MHLSRCSEPSESSRQETRALPSDRSSKPPVPARIYLPVPGSEEARLVAAWAEVTDPSRTMISPEPPTERVFEPLRLNPYVPSFSDYTPQPLPAPTPAAP